MNNVTHAVDASATNPSTRAPKIPWLLLLIPCAVLLVRPCGATPDAWDYTNSLNSAREYHTATLLPTGRVLVAAGGSDEDGSSATAELYDPASGLWSFTGSLTGSRKLHTATLLPNGKVLVAGGYDSSVGGGKLATCELYDPATGAWTGTGSLNDGRYDHTATLLPNGTVLVAGGVTPNGYLASAELYDPASGNWSATSSLQAERGLHTATLLPSGKVLVAGGRDLFGVLASAELYDPATGNWSSTGSLNTARVAHTATLLQNGMVLVAGGTNSSGPLMSAELYDPTTGLWTFTGSLSTARDAHSATLLPDGHVLAAGGVSLSQVLISELYDPVTGTWSNTGSLNQARYFHTATLLPDGTVLAAGGQGSSVFALATCELYGAPETLPSHVQGRGAFDNAGSSVTFQFKATQGGNDILGYFSFCDEAAGYCTNRGRVTSLSFNGNSATMDGYVKLSGRRVDFTVTITDGGSTGSDSIAITLTNGYSAGGTLTSGDIKIQ